MSRTIKNSRFSIEIDFADTSTERVVSPLSAITRCSFPTIFLRNGFVVTDCQQAKIEQLTQENAHLQMQLEQSQKMAALGELVSTTTHEFNNVLMTIINYARMGMRHDDKPTRDKAFNKINQAGERAARITKSVLGMARNRSESFEATDLAKLIDGSMVLLEREMQKYRIGVEMELEEVPQVSAMGNQIQQVILNLLINARQAMPDGGRLVIRLKPGEAGQFVDLSVRDYGTGMAEETLHRIFEPYYSTKSGPDESGKGGTGLGLATCKKIIEAHGGKIRVDSSLGKGTCFTLRFPAIRSALAAPNIANATTQSASMNVSAE